MIKQNRIHFLDTPLVTVGDRVKKYYYSLDEFKKAKGDKNNVRYLKGLGSLSLEAPVHFSLLTSDGCCKSTS